MPPVLSPLLKKRRRRTRINRQVDQDQNGKGEKRFVSPEERDLEARQGRGEEPRGPERQGFLEEVQGEMNGRARARAGEDFGPPFPGKEQGQNVNGQSDGDGSVEGGVHPEEERNVGQQDPQPADQVGQDGAQQDEGRAPRRFPQKRRYGQNVRREVRHPLTAPRPEEQGAAVERVRPEKEERHAKERKDGQEVLVGPITVDVISHDIQRPVGPEDGRAGDPEPLRIPPDPASGRDDRVPVPERESVLGRPDDLPPEENRPAGESGRIPPGFGVGRIMLGADPGRKDDEDGERRQGRSDFPKAKPV